MLIKEMKADYKKVLKAFKSKKTKDLYGLLNDDVLHKDYGLQDLEVRLYELYLIEDHMADMNTDREIRGEDPLTLDEATYKVAEFWLKDISLRIMLDDVFRYSDDIRFLNL